MQSFGKTVNSVQDMLCGIGLNDEARGATADGKFHGLCIGFSETITMIVFGHSAHLCGNRSSPSYPGITMSTHTMSGPSLATKASPSSPFAASPTER